MKKIMIINGPNLNFLGIREKSIYGNDDYESICSYYAILDAIKSISIPTVEVHLSNIHEREEFRKTSVTAAACIAQIYGKGKDGYVEAIKLLLRGENC